VAEAMSRLKNTDEWTALPFPGPQASALVTYGPSYSLLATTPERQLAAWLFVRWSLSVENQAKWAAATGSLPLRTSALDALGDYRAGQPQWAAAVTALPLARSTPELASWRRVRYLLEDGTLSIFRLNVPVDQIPAVLAEMDAMAEELGK
jgi:multiple sugar transport system substrate-binding protein